LKILLSEVPLLGILKLVHLFSFFILLLSLRGEAKILDFGQAIFRIEKKVYYYHEVRKFAAAKRKYQCLFPDSFILELSPFHFNQQSWPAVNPKKALNFSNIKEDLQNIQVYFQLLNFGQSSPFSKKEMLKIIRKKKKCSNSRKFLTELSLWHRMALTLNKRWKTQSKWDHDRFVSKMAIEHPHWLKRDLENSFKRKAPQLKKEFLRRLTTPLAKKAEYVRYY